MELNVGDLGLGRFWSLGSRVRVLHSSNGDCTGYNSGIPNLSPNSPNLDPESPKKPRSFRDRTINTAFSENRKLAK